MKRLRFALYDQTGYMKLLADYLGKRNTLVESRLFTQRSSLDKYLETNLVDVLLLGQEIDHFSYCPLEQVGQVIIMTDGEILREHQDTPVIFKYQSAECIVREIFSIIAKDGEGSIPGFGRGQRVKKIAFCAPYGSPFHLNRSFLLDHMLEYSDQGLVIHLGLFPDIPAEETTAGMSELIFYLKQRKEDCMEKLLSLIGQREGMAMISPVADYRDLQSLSMEDVDLLLELLTQQREYDAIFFPIGLVSESMLYLMENCDAIYMPRVEHEWEKFQQQAVQNLLIREGMTEVLQSIQYITAMGGS